MAGEDQAGEGDAAISNAGIAQLQQQAAFNKLLMIAVLVISTIVISVMATGMTVMFTRLAKLTEMTSHAEDVPMEQQFQLLEKQVLLVADFRKSELKKINAYTHQLETIANDCSAEKAMAYKTALVNREADFQAMLETIKSASSNLATMSSGSRTWLDEHTKALDQLKQSSQQRRQSLENL